MFTYCCSFIIHFSSPCDNGYKEACPDRNLDYMLAHLFLLHNFRIWSFLISPFSINSSTRISFPSYILHTSTIPILHPNQWFIKRPCPTHVFIQLPTKLGRHRCLVVSQLKPITAYTQFSIISMQTNILKNYLIFITMPHL